MLAGLVSLPREPQEAAQILGARRWHIFWEVQGRLLRPVILLALILRFLESMAEFPKTWALLQGGPGSATETAPVYIFINTRSEEHTSELQSLMRISYAVFCLKKKKIQIKCISSVDLHNKCTSQTSPPQTYATIYN